MKVDLEDGGPAQQIDLSGYEDRGAVGMMVIVQNLGPGDVYVDQADDVTSDSGVKIAANGYWEFSSITGQYFVADGGDADVRVTVVG